MSASRQLWLLVVCLAATGCSSDTGNPLLDLGTIDKGSTTTDKGGTTTDKGGAATDKGGTTTDKGAGACNPNFGQPQACGGTVVGKWKYTAGCVADAAFDELKKDCAGVQISGVAYAMPPTNTVHFLAGGTFTRSFTGSVTGKALFGQACTKLGCVALAAALKLGILKYPGSTVTCAPVTGSGCDCTVELKLAAFAAGTYKTSGGVLTATALAVDYPFYYCVQGTQAQFRGTAQNLTDQNVTYVLESVL